MDRISNLSIYSIFLIPFINFSPIASSNISFSMIGIFLCFISLLRSKKIFISQESFFLILFIFFTIISQVFSLDTVSNKYFSQIINIFFITLCFIAFNSLSYNFDKIHIYDYYFKCGVTVCLVSFFFFAIAFIAKTDAALYFVRFFNNSGNFSGTGVNLHVGSLFSEVRMNLIFPEPSFFSMYISSIIGVSIILKKPKKIILILLFFLLLTVGRTGFLAVVILFAALFLVKFIRPNRLSRGFIGILLLIAPIFFYLAIFSYLTNLDYSFFQRVSSIENAFLYAKDSIIYGHGFDTYSSEMRSIGYHSGDIFNFPLNLLVSGGLLAFVPFTAFIFFIFFNTPLREFPILCSIMGIFSTIPNINIYFLILIMAVACSNRINGLNLK